MRLVFFRFSILVLANFSVLTTLAQTPPSQPTSGPGGSDYTHETVSVFNYGQGDEGFWLFEPSEPTPDSADVVVLNHGLGQINPMVHGGWIKHLVKKGNIVIYPKYQDDLNTPDSVFVPSAAVGISNAIDTLQNGLGHVRPNLNHFVMIGHSYGGIISANLTVLQQEYGLPEIKGLMVAQGYVDAEMRLATYELMPDNTKLLIVVGSEDGVVGDEFARLLMDSANVNCEYKNLVTHFPDNHGSPGLGAGHEQSLAWEDEYDSGESNFWVLGAQFVTSTDAVDFFAYWKLSEALLNCAFYNENCEYAFGDTPEQRNMGVWSDGTSVVELSVEQCEPSGLFHDEHIRDHVIIYPNPSTGVFVVEAKNKIEFAELIDPTGRLIKSIQVLDGKRFLVDLNGMSEGMYLLQTKSELGVTSNKLMLH